MEIKLDTSAFRAVAARLSAAGKEIPNGLARALNATGDATRKAMVPILTAQTGLKKRTIVKALKKSSASRASLSYVIRSDGGDIALKFFGARETTKGVTAAPWGKRQLYPMAFLKGGKAPNRVALNLGGQVYERTGAARTPIAKIKSGVFIPKEMVKGATAAAFESTVASEFPNLIAKEIGRILG